MQARDYVDFIRRVNNGTFEGNVRDAIRLYRRINEMFINHKGHSPFSVKLPELRERLQWAEEESLVEEIDQIRFE